MSKKTKKNVEPSNVVENPVLETGKFLESKGYIVYVSMNHKQIWRVKLVHKLAKLLGVSIMPAVTKKPEGLTSSN